MIIYCDVKEVQASDDYTLEISFVDGSRKLFDMKPYLKLKVFRDLQNTVMFSTVHVAFGSIEWANKADFDPEALYDLGLPLKD